MPSRGSVPVTGQQMVWVTCNVILHYGRHNLEVSRESPAEKDAIAALLGKLEVD